MVVTRSKEELAGGRGREETYSGYLDFNFGEYFLSLLFVKRILPIPVEVGFFPSIPIQDL